MKIEFETYVIFVSFITSFFAVFLSNGIIIGVPAIAQDFAMNNVIQNWVPTIFSWWWLSLQFRQVKFQENSESRNH